MNRDKEIESKIIEPLQYQNRILLAQNKGMKSDLLKVTDNVRKLEDFSEENKELHKENRQLSNENYDLKYKISILERIIDTVKETAYQFMLWICKKFSLSPEATTRKFERETDRLLNPIDQIEKEDLLLKEQQEFAVAKKIRKVIDPSFVKSKKIYV